MRNILRYPIKITLSALFVIALYSCGYDEIADADFPSSKIYMPSAISGIYTIAAAPPPVGASRFKLDEGETKFIVPLSIYRSGIDANGGVDVSLGSKPDTIASLLDNGVLVGVESLPAEQYTIPESVAINNGEDIAKFELAVDLNFLLGNTDKKFALAVGIADSDLPVTAALGTTIIVIDAALFIPTANFTFAKSGTDPLLYTFTNSSVNGATYSWSFGDGSTPSNERAPIHKFTNTGTYTVELTTMGVAGAFSSVKTVEIVVE